MLSVFLVFCRYLALILSALSLRGERARASYYRRPLPDGPTPPVTVIVPIKGLDEHLQENLAALTALDYPDFELILTARSQEDVPQPLIPPNFRVVYAGTPPPNTAEKIHNLLAAIQSARTESQVYVFADSDGRVPRQWLRALVAPLSGPAVGAVTGYRWHLPQPVDAPSLLRSVWNAVIAGGMGPGGNAFCWGGAMAIRRDTFQQRNIPAWWQGAVSDDYRLGEAVKHAGLTIAFAPQALVASTDHTSLAELLRWTRRQMMITRFYAPKLWGLALFAHIVYCTAMVDWARLSLQGSPLALLALTWQLGTGFYKAANRLHNARSTMPEHTEWFRRYALLHTILTPLGTWLWLWSCAAAAFGKVIHWRGYSYRLRRLPPRNL